MVKAALANPHGLPKLSEFARGLHSAVIVTCDRTRGVPSKITIPPILDELKAAGLDSKHVKILVATGLHKGETITDVRERLGDLQNIEIRVHNSDELKELIFLGTLSSNTPLFLNRALVESDLVILEGTVEPHFFAGFTGGSKIVLPGAAATETILRNHSWQNIDDARSRSGFVNNPIRRDADEALRFLKKTFALNVILNENKRIVFATSGEPIDSFNVATEQVSAQMKVEIKNRPDVVITTNGGYPLDRNVYQCVKGISVPEEILKPNTRIVMVSECADGIAHEEFRKILLKGSPNEIYERLKNSRSTIHDQWQVQILCRILRHNPVWFVTRSELQSSIESMHMHYASTIEEALDAAQLSKGERVLVVPQGPSTILHSE